MLKPISLFILFLFSFVSLQANTALPAADDVTIVSTGSTVVMKNGIIEATITKSTGQIETIMYNGVDILAGGYDGGKFYWSWNMPNYQNPANCTYTLTVDPATNNYTYAEIKLHMQWNGSGSTAAMDLDIYYSLKKDVSGLYAAAKLSHPPAYPLNPGGEWRMSSYPGSTFNWMSVDAERNRIMPTQADMAASVAVPGAPAEVVRLTTGTYANHYECKYDYSADFGDIDTWGWSSTSKNIGVWMTAPSKEYYPGGPMKRELMCHVNPVLLNMIGGTHYAQGTDGIVAAGETWEKLYGPFLIYCNKVPLGTANASMALWNDAKLQAKAEQAQWPYSWFTEPTYIKANGRGTITGKLVISDSGNPNASAADMWIGVAIPPSSTSGVTDFQLWTKNYQFWVKTDASGNFSIPNVLPGTYNMYAFGSGSAGQMTKNAFLTVTAGTTTALGNVTWIPDRVAPTIWEIGIPDRTAKEFKHGTDWWVPGIYPNPNWAKFMDYTSEFPNGITHTIGQSNWATDWNFVQQYNLITTDQTAAPEWKVKFTLATAPTSGSNSSVYLAAASAFGAPMFVKINGTNITTPSTGVNFPNSSNATIRKGIHGAFGDLRFTFPSSLLLAGENVISFTLRRAGGDIQYDYIRLESPGTSLTLPAVTSFTPTTSGAGSTVTITGTNFTGASAVSFGGVAAASYTVTSPNTITAIIASGASGEVSVTAGGGTGKLTGFTFVPKPIITATGPNPFVAGASILLSANPGTGYSYKWARNGTDIPGATSSTFTATEIGSYTVTITANLYSTSSVAHVISTTFTLPANNFSLSTTGETCKTSNNGKVNIAAQATKDYTAILSGNGLNDSKAFSKNLEYKDLAAGVYSVCITVANEANYKQCFDLTVTEPQDLSVYTSVNKETNKITLNLNGASVYTIILNGKSYQTNQNQFILDLAKGDNSLRVTTDTECQGAFEKKISLFETITVYPNPFENILNLENGDWSNSNIEIRSLDGRLVFSQLSKSANGTLAIDLSHLKQGIYLLRVHSPKLESIYKIVKK
ncbi:MAG: T9SS type A sorting domain-containing protein [Pyrinomonadaceae bacterium]|nr:T9SS type A sorting domain-containing protein [Sphingobacteriaceae bacterium]